MKTYRSELLSLTHETPLSGHLGINKAYQKIITQFYWPGVRKDVIEFRKNCHTCRVVGKQNQTISKAPLKPIQAFEESFGRILIDCVGPLPKTKKGNQYLLTMHNVRFTSVSESNIIKKYQNKNNCSSIDKVFYVGRSSKSIQSDQGSYFMSGIFQQVTHELQITILLNCM